MGEIAEWMIDQAIWSEPRWDQEYTYKTKLERLTEDFEEEFENES